MLMDGPFDGWPLLICGHGSGGAAAALLASRWVSDSNFASVEVRAQIRAVAFNAPCTVSPEESVALEGFVTSVVVGCDVVSRLSPVSVRRLLRILGTLAKTEEQDNLGSGFRQNVSLLGTLLAQGGEDTDSCNSKNKDGRDLRISTSIVLAAIVAAEEHLDAVSKYDQETEGTGQEVQSASESLTELQNPCVQVNDGERPQFARPVEEPSSFNDAFSNVCILASELRRIASLDEQASAPDVVLVPPGRTLLLIPAEDLSIDARSPELDSSRLTAGRAVVVPSRGTDFTELVVSVPAMVRHHLPQATLQLLTGVCLTEAEDNGSLDSRKPSSETGGIGVSGDGQGSSASSSDLTVPFPQELVVRPT